MARTRAAQAEAARKTADNADRVAQLNGQPELVFTVATRGNYHLLAHRPTCKRFIATKVVEQPSRHDPVEPASCCKPSADLVRTMVARIRADQPEPHADKAADAKAKLHDRVRDVPTDNPDAQQPPRPATPNLDALNAEYAAGVTAKDRKRQRTTTRTRSTTSRQRVELGTLPKGATEGTCRTCQQTLPAAKFPKAVVAGERQKDQRADECRACRDARRHGTAATA